MSSTPEMVYPVSNELRHSRTTQDTTLPIKCRNEKKFILKKFYIGYKFASQNFPSLNVLNEYTACAYIKYVVMRNDKNGSKCGRFSEEYPTCGRFYKTI